MDELIRRVERLVKKQGYDTTLHILDLLNDIGHDINIRYLFDIQYLRRWIYNNLPRQGFNLTDIDLLVNKYCTNGNINDEKIMLIEFKYGTNPHRLLKNQHNPFYIIDSYLRGYSNYYGFHVVTIDNYNLNNATSIYINNAKVTVNEFKEFLIFKGRYESCFNT